MATAVACIGVWEKSEGHVVWAGHVPSFLKVEDPSALLALSGSSRAATGEHRVQSTSGTSLGLAEFLALSLPFIIHFTTAGHKWYIRMAASFTIPLLVYVILLTQSRLGIVGCLITIMGYIFFWSILRWRQRPNSLVAPFLIAMYPVLLGMAIGATFLVGHLRAVVWGNGPQQASNDARLFQYQTGIPKIISHPWGYGPGMAGEVVGYVDPSGLLTIDTYYLAIAIDYGVIGFLLYYGLILFSIWHAAMKAVQPSSRRGELVLFLPIALTLINFFVIKSVFSEQDNHPIIFMILGMMVALAYRARKNELSHYNLKT